MSPGCGPITIFMYSEYTSRSSDLAHDGFAPLFADPRLARAKPWVILSLLLLHESSNPGSRYADYIASLPKATPDVPWVWQEEDLDSLLSQSPTLERAMTRKKKVHNYYSTIVQPVLEAAKAPRIFTEDEFNWAVAIVQTRAFLFDSPGGGDYWALTPFCDYMNHQSVALANCRAVIHPTGDLSVVALRDLQQDEEITFSYGSDLDSYHLFSRYGFLLPADPDFEQVRWPNLLTAEDVPHKAACEQFLLTKHPAYAMTIKQCLATLKNSVATLESSMLAVYRLYAWTSAVGDLWQAPPPAAPAHLPGQKAKHTPKPPSSSTAAGSSATPSATTPATAAGGSPSPASHRRVDAGKVVLEGEEVGEDNWGDFDFDYCTDDEPTSVVEVIYTQHCPVTLTNELGAMRLVVLNCDRMLEKYEQPPKDGTSTESRTQLTKALIQREVMVVQAVRAKAAARVFELAPAVELFSGKDTDGKGYASLDEFWAHITKMGVLAAWYNPSINYWDEIPATISGVMGGFECVHDSESGESLTFLRPFCPWAGAKDTVALEAGAGIGRVSQAVLLQLCDKVDVMEPCKHLLDQARNNLPADRVLGFYCLGLQNFDFPRSYDLICIQWCALYLTDDDFIAVLKQCRAALTAQGVIFVKENLTRNGFLMDLEDTSIGRTDRHHKHLFRKAGLTLLGCQRQVDWPVELLPVKMYALQ
eukprot:NODE_97_length_2599_cov_61.674510_g64_i0.p1 GENE.NODE_97_length_2599_cov_61.674510_g64_i0~~NODE_97_length_2599_cov_61.674510_g64_i0.p1  ORF type:complete len:701 (-),score=162.86 NODE_97_length_2599_cov_61.674510_g64_i0:282-2384(-)